MYLFYFVFKLVSVEKASAITGWISWKGGQFSDVHKVGRRNLEKIFPENTYEQNSEILKKVWDNFGRNMGEYLHLTGIDIYNDPRFEIIGAEHIDRLRDDGKPAVIFGAHLANWEVGIMGLNQRGLKLAQLYKTRSNPYLDRIVRKSQEKISNNEVLNKGTKDAKRIVELMNRNGHLFMLLDQKMKQGISVPFFGYDALTAPAGARLAIKYDCPFLPVQVERLGGFKFRITYHPPLEVSKTGDLNKDLYVTLSAMNAMIESWVRARPEQWLWIYKRWPNDWKSPVL